MGCKKYELTLMKEMMCIQGIWCSDFKNIEPGGCDELYIMKMTKTFFPE